MFRIKWLNNILKLLILGVANFLVISISEVFGGLHGKATLVIRSLVLKDREFYKRCFLFCFFIFSAAIVCL